MKNHHNDPRKPTDAAPVTRSKTWGVLILLLVFVGPFISVIVKEITGDGDLSATVNLMWVVLAVGVGLLTAFQEWRRKGVPR